MPSLITQPSTIISSDQTPLSMLSRDRADMYAPLQIILNRDANKEQQPKLTYEGIQQARQQLIHMKGSIRTQDNAETRKELEGEVTKRMQYLEDLEAKLAKRQEEQVTWLKDFILEATKAKQKIPFSWQAGKRYHKIRRDIDHAVWHCQRAIRNGFKRNPSYALLSYNDLLGVKDDKNQSVLLQSPKFGGKNLMRVSIPIMDLDALTVLSDEAYKTFVDIQKHFRIQIMRSITSLDAMVKSYNVVYKTTGAVLSNMNKNSAMYNNIGFSRGGGSSQSFHSAPMRPMPDGSRGGHNKNAFQSPLSPSYMK